MARKAKQTNEQVLERWLAGSAKNESGYSVLGYLDLERLGWEAGQDGYMTIVRTEAGVTYGVNYERFYPEVLGGGYVVIEWDDDGNVGVC